MSKFNIKEIRRARDYLKNRVGIKNLTEQGIKHYLLLSSYYEICCNDIQKYCKTLRHRNFKSLDENICPVLYKQIKEKFDVDALNRKIIKAKEEAFIASTKKVHYKYQETQKQKIMKAKLENREIEKYYWEIQHLLNK